MYLEFVFVDIFDSIHVNDSSWMIFFSKQKGKNEITRATFDTLYGEYVKVPPENCSVSSPEEAPGAAPSNKKFFN